MAMIAAAAPHTIAARPRGDPRRARADRPHVHRTPVLTCASLDEAVGARLFFKCENFQKVGAFKARGACNAVFSLTDEAAARGVVTHSSGNHGAALAYAAQRRGIPAWVVMPENAPKVKQANVAPLRRDDALLRADAGGARAGVRRRAARDRRDAGPSVRRRARDRGTGHGGARAPRRRARPRRRHRAGRRRRPAVGHRHRGARRAAGHPVYGAEPAGADDAARSFASGKVEPLPHPATIADGLRATLSARTLQAMRRHVAAIRTASEERSSRDAHDLGADEDRHRAVVRGAARVPAGDRSADRRQARRHHRQRRQRRSRPAAMAVA